MSKRCYNSFNLLISFLVIVISISSCQRPKEDLLQLAIEGRAELIDLSHTLDNTIPYYPGGTRFELTNLASIDQGYYMNSFCTGEHTGTHVDAPAHFVAESKYVDQIPLRQLVGPAIVIDVEDKAKENPDYQLTLDEVKVWEDLYGRIPDHAFVLMHTGWGSRWDNLDEYRNMDDDKVLHFPGFSAEVAEFLVDEREINGVGIDDLSIDYGPSSDFAAHKVFLAAGKIQLENLARVQYLPPTGAFLIVAPLKIRDGSGSPARVIGIATR